MTPQIGEPAPYICYACANGRHSDCKEEACECSHRAQPSRPAAPESDWACPLHGDVWCSCPRPTEMSVKEVIRRSDVLVQAMTKELWKDAIIKWPERLCHTRECAVHEPTLRPCNCGVETRLKDEIRRLLSVDRHLSLAQTEIKGLRAERDLHYTRLAGLLFSGALDKYTGGDVQSWAAEYTKKLTDAQSRIAELEKDAARYRWLRECSVTRSDRTIYVMHNLYTNGLFLRSDYPSQDRLDAAIDEALKSSA